MLTFYAFIQTMKGNLYILITASLLWILIVRESKEKQLLMNETIRSKRVYQNYFNQGFIAIFVMDTAFNIVRMNVKAKELFVNKYAKEEVNNFDTLLYDPMDRKSVIQKLSRLKDLGVTVEARLKRCRRRLLKCFNIN